MNKFNIFFISYNESNADQNYQNLIQRGLDVVRVHGIEGIANAYYQAASKSTTEHFFTIDGDNFVLADFNFNEVKNLIDHPNSVHVWRCRNAVNGLIYGYGGVKLFPKNIFLSPPKDYLDFTTTIGQAGYFIQKDLASETRFNVTPLEAWRGGFREAVKLSLELHTRPIPQTLERLKSWLFIGLESRNGAWAILGARMGYAFAHENNFEKEYLSFINNFEWLKEEYLKLEGKDPELLLNKYVSRILPE